MSTSASPSPNAARTPDDLGHQSEALGADLSANLSANLSDGAARAGQQVSRTGRDARDGATMPCLAIR